MTPSVLADGVYTVVATQTDWGPNTGTSNTNTFTIETNAPTVTITAPSSGDLLNSPAVFTTAPYVSYGGNIAGTAGVGGRVP